MFKVIYKIGPKLGVKEMKEAGPYSTIDDAKNFQIPSNCSFATIEDKQRGEKWIWNKTSEEWKLLGGDSPCQVRLKLLLAKSIEPLSVRPAGRYTDPRTWGVYQVERLLDGERVKPFHFGNHPVRQQELIRQYGDAQLLYLYDTPNDAEAVADLLNGCPRNAQ
jgi:hypothetical protein